MTTMVQSMIEDANRRVKASNSRVFGKKATDQKVHENLLKSVEIHLSNPTKASLVELGVAMRLSSRNLKP